MSKNYLRIACGLTIVLSFGAFAQAQDRTLASVAGEKYVISARAGGVNYVSGDVKINRSGRSSSLNEGDEIETGELLSTGASSRAEILLNPGSYMRVDANSSVELAETSLDDLKVKIHAGSAIFEVFASNKFRVAVASPRGRVFLVESGIYEVNVDARGAATVYVWEGLATLDAPAAPEVKRSRAGTIADGTATIAKFDRDDERSEFVSWSKARGKELAKATQAIKDKTLRPSLLNSFNAGGWGMYNSFGLWVRDWRTGRRCFLPFGHGWYSPYGYWYGNSIWWYNLGPVIFQPQPTSDPRGIKVRTRTEAGGDPRISRQPPFRQIENEAARTKNPIRQVTPDYPTDRNPSGPVYVPPPPPIYVPIPVPTGTKSRP